MRIRWVDNAKALGIFLVILGHEIQEPYLKQYIYSFHMPVFFFISGYLFNPSKYTPRQFIQKRFKTLIIPYLCFAFLSLLFWLLVVRRLSIGGESLAVAPIKPLIGVFYGIGSGDWKVPLNQALWFLPCLFVVEIVFYFVKQWYVLPAFAIAGYLVTFLSFRLPWSADTALTAIVFYGIGYLYKEKWEAWLSRKDLPLLLAVSLIFCFLNSRVDMNNLAYGNVLYFYISALAGILFYVKLCELVETNKVIEYVGSNTVILIGSVGITAYFLRGVAYLLLHTTLKQPGPGWALVLSILEIVFTVPAIYCINRWLPFVIGKSRASGTPMRVQQQF